MISIFPYKIVKIKNQDLNYNNQQRITSVIKKLSYKYNENNFKLKTSCMRRLTLIGTGTIKEKEDEILITIRFRFALFEQSLTVFFLLIFGILFSSIAMIDLYNKKSIEKDLLPFIYFFWTWYFMCMCGFNFEVNKLIKNINANNR